MKMDKAQRPGTTRGMRRKKIGSMKYRPGTAAYKQKKRLQSGKKLRPRTHKSAKPPIGQRMYSAR